MSSSFFIPLHPCSLCYQSGLEVESRARGKSDPLGQLSPGHRLAQTPRAPTGIPNLCPPQEINAPQEPQGDLGTRSFLALQLPGQRHRAGSWSSSWAPGPMGPPAAAWARCQRASHGAKHPHGANTWLCGSPVPSSSPRRLSSVHT